MLTKKQREKSLFPQAQVTGRQSGLSQIVASSLELFEDFNNPISATAPDGWSNWLPVMFPQTFTSEFCKRHAMLWDWVDNLEAGKKPKPSCYASVQPRGGGKTTTAESAVVRVGAIETRKFVLYVRSTQDKANESVKNIGSKLQAKELARYYPLVSRRSEDDYGNSKGWTVKMLRCANGFNVAGLGLDASVRGVKLDDFRPDLIVLDDIDHKMDTPAKVEKKIATITADILPAGATHCAYLFVQNLIHSNSIMTMMVNDKAEFLYDRNKPIIVHKAVDNLEYKERQGGGYNIIGGEATWSGQSLEVCESQINDWGLPVFLKEAQHEVEESGGIWDHVDFVRCDIHEVPDLISGATWIDPAVTSTNKSDCHAIAAGGLGEDKKLYVFYSFEQVTSPEDIMRRGILTCLKYGFEILGVETDQGGDSWRSVYKVACQELLENSDYPEIKHEVDDVTRKIVKEFRFPKFKQAKAGSGHGSKIHRNAQMLVDYQHQRVVHVRGTHDNLEKALRRFPNKPLDLADALYWLWYNQIRKRKRGLSFA